MCIRVRQLCFTQRVTILFLLIGITVSSATILNSWAIHEEFTPTEEVPPIPSWIKTTVGWWADDKVTDIEFLEGITYLIDNRIIVITDSSTLKDIDNATESVIPKWIKNNAKWWVDGNIPDSAFISGLQWLIKNGIMQISLESISFIPIEDVKISRLVAGDKHNLTHLFSALFETYVNPMSYIIDDDGIKKWTSPILGLNPYKMDQYNDCLLYTSPSPRARG